jgi:hypothetical protein
LHVEVTTIVSGVSDVVWGIYEVRMSDIVVRERAYDTCSKYFSNLLSISAVLLSKLLFHTSNSGEDESGFGDVSIALSSSVFHILGIR